DVLANPSTAYHTGRFQEPRCELPGEQSTLPDEGPQRFRLFLSQLFGGPLPATLVETAQGPTSPDSGRGALPERARWPPKDSPSLSSLRAALAHPQRGNPPGTWSALGTSPLAAAAFFYPFFRPFSPCS